MRLNDCTWWTVVLLVLLTATSSGKVVYAGNLAAMTGSEKHEMPQSASGCTSAQDNAQIIKLRLRIHLANSAFRHNEAVQAGKEINRIWLDQARICFEEEFTESDKTGDGFDLWFNTRVPGWNGFYRSAHEMYVRDQPELAPCSDPARNAAGRTAAHEIGHALGLSHRQDSNNNLMRSKTYGWKLNAGERAAARKRARLLSHPGQQLPCRMVFLDKLSRKEPL